MKTYYRTFLIQFIISHSLYASLWYDEQKVSDCRLKNLGGSQSVYTCGIREFLKKVNETKQGPTGYALLFYGHPGTGKTASAQAIAEESGAQLNLYKVENLVSGRIRDRKNCSRVIDRMHALFRQAEYVTKETQQPVIIVLDEIDILVSKKKEWKKYIFALLRTELDRQKDNPFITIILTCNSHEGIDEALVDRCIRVKWNMPTLEDRKEIITLLAKKYNLECSEKFIDSLAQKTRDFTGRHFKTTFKNIQKSAQEQNIPLTQELLVQSISQIQKEINQDKSWKRWWAETLFFYF